MSDRTLKAYIAFVGVAQLVVVGVGSVAGSVAVADDLQMTAERSLADAGLDGVAVDFRGREAELSGGSRADRTEARAIVDRITGVRRTVVDTSEDGAPRPTATVTVDSTVPRLDLRRTPGGATISGVVPDPDAQARIRAAAATAFGTIRGDLLVDPSVDGADWVERVAELFAAVADVDDVEIRIDDDRLELDGTMASDLDRDRVVQLVVTVVPGLDVVDRIDVTGDGG